MLAQTKYGGGAMGELLEARGFKDHRTIFWYGLLPNIPSGVSASPPKLHAYMKIWEKQRVVLKDILKYVCR